MTMLRIGKIINSHGHLGEVKVLPLTDDIKRFKKLRDVYLEVSDSRYDLVHIVQSRIHNGQVLLTLEEAPDMNAAERLKNFYLCVKREDAIKLPEDHFFIYEIIGLEVVEEGQVLGKVVEVLQTGGNDVYAVSDGVRTFYMPALKAVVQKIDLENKQMLVKLPTGLLD